MEEPAEVTREEVLALYEGEAHNRVWSVQQIAERVWRARGGEGVWDGPPRLRSGNVPLVVARHVHPILRSLRDEQILTSAVGGKANSIGVAYDGPRSGVRYYGLASYAERRRAEAAKKNDAHNHARQAAVVLRAALGDCATSVGAPCGHVEARFTPEQAVALAVTLQNLDHAYDDEPVAEGPNVTSAVKPQLPRFHSVPHTDI